MTREGLLAGDARAVFGDAIGDPRALKRAYAALVKRFGPESDPEAFEALRRLYEAACAAPAPAAPGAEAEPPPAEVPLDAAIAALRAAVAERRFTDAFAILQAHDLALRVEKPGLWFGAVTTLVDALTFQLPVDVLQSWLDATDHPPEGLPAASVERIEVLALAGLAYQQARADPFLVPELFQLLDTWGQPAEAVARAFAALGAALPDPEAAWAQFAHVRRYHPGVHQVLTLMADLVTVEHDAWLALRDGGYRPDRRGGPLVGPPAPRAGVARLTGAAVLAALAVGAALAGFGLEVAGGQTWLGVAAGAIGYVAYAVVRPGSAGWPTYAVLRAHLVPEGRARGLFPHEILALANEDTSMWLSWQQDPSILCHVITEAHLARIRGRAAAP